MEFTKAAKGLKGQLAVPGDKSISHRAVMLGSIASGTYGNPSFSAGSGLSVHHLLLPAHGRRNREPRKLWCLVHGKGMQGLSAPSGHAGLRKQRHYHAPDVGNSGGPAIFLHSYRRCFHPEAPHEADHGASDSDGGPHFQPAGEWLRSHCA